MAEEISWRPTGVDCEGLRRSEDTLELLGVVTQHCSGQPAVNVSEHDNHDQIVDG